MQHFVKKYRSGCKHLVSMSSLGKAEHVCNKNIKLSFVGFLKFGSSCRNSTWWLCNLIILMHLRTDWSMMRGQKVKLIRENHRSNSDKPCLAENIVN